MPTLYQYYQALQVFRYLYTTRYSSYNFTRKNIVSRSTSSGISYTKREIHVYTDASFTTQSSQGGYIILIDNMYVASKSFRIKHHTSCSYEAEILALRQGVNAALNVQSSLFEFGYRRVSITAHCDNLPVVNTVKGLHVQDNKSLIYMNCLHALKDIYHRGDMMIEHISGSTNPADLLTKTLGPTALQNLLSGEILRPIFQMVRQTNAHNQHFADLFDRDEKSSTSSQLFN